MSRFSSLSVAKLSVLGLSIALVGSWIWFLVIQQRMNAQLNALTFKSEARATPNGRGALDPYRDKAVKNTVRKQANAIQQLWLAHLKQQAAVTEGSVEVDWQIDADGSVVDIGVVHSDFADSTLNRGVVKVIQATRFPPPPGKERIYIAHKFKFKKE